MFLDELSALLNKYSIENCSNTPDFILASFLEKVLKAWNDSISEREAWHGNDTGISSLREFTTEPNYRLR